METSLHPTVEPDALALLEAASSGWARPVPDCPGWDAAELVRHTGGVLSWIGRTVGGGGEPVRRSSPDRPPEGTDGLTDWFRATLDGSLRELAATRPDAPAWTFSSHGDHRAAWWSRRVAVELALHRYDAQRAVAADSGPPAEPLDGAVAAAGVEEFLLEFLPGLLREKPAEPATIGAGPPATLHLHALDGDCEWSVDLSTGAATPGHGKADTAVRGTRSALLLWLTKRAAPGDVEVLGRQETAAGWVRLRR